MIFTVIGAFPTVEKAKQVQQELLQLFDDILACAPRNKYPDETPTWPEVAISQKYDIEWNERLNWIEDPLEKHVSQFLNYVFVNQVVETSQYPNAIAALLGKMTDQVFVKGLLDHEYIVLTEMRCTAPETQPATSIASEINLYLGAKDVEFLLPPWEMYCPFLELSHYELLTKPYDHKPDTAILQQAVSALYQYQKAKIERQPLIKPEKNAIDALIAMQNDGYSFSYSLDAEFLSKLIHSAGGVSGSTARGLPVKTQGQKISISEIWFLQPQLGIPAIYLFLEDKGCTNIEFSLKSVSNHPYTFITKPPIVLP